MGDDAGGLVVALAELKGSVDTGFAKLDGRLDVALQRQDTTERELRELKKRVSSLEAKVWKFSMAAAAVGTAGATGVWQVLQ